MRQIFASLLFAFTSLAFAQPQTLTTSGVQSVTGAKTFSPSKLCVAGSSSGTVCVETAAAAGTGTLNIGTGGTLAALAFASSVNLATQVSGNLGVSNLGSGSGASSSTFWRGDGSWATPAGAGDVSGPASVTADGNFTLFNGTTGKIIKDGGTPAAGVLTFLITPSSANLKSALTDELGSASGKAIFAEGTLAITSGKTLTATNTLTLSGTDSTVMTFPSTSATIARTDAANTFTGVQVFSSAPTFSSTTAGRVLLAGASGALTDSANLTLINTNTRLQLSVSNNGDVSYVAHNPSTGNAAYAAVFAINSANFVGLYKNSTGLTTAGLLVADQAVISNSTGQMLIANAASADIIFSRSGTAAANEKFRIDGTGVVVQGATAIPAGGTAATGLRFSSTSNFGVFFGSGAPTLSAAKGSLYLRSDGSGVADRAYINTDGGTTWTSIATAG